MEQLIVVTIFAICASICVNIFIGSYFMANDTRDMNRALIFARNGAECYKAYGDLEKTAAVLGGEYNLEGDSAVVYYDAGGLVCGKKEAVYALHIKKILGNAADENFEFPLLCKISVDKMMGKEIIGFTAAARRRAGFNE